MQITVMQFGEGEIIGYVFKFVDPISKKSEINSFEKTLIPFGNKEIDVPEFISINLFMK